METVVEYVLRTVAIVVIVVGVISSGFVLLLSAPGLMAFFVAVLVAVTVLGSGAALLAIDFLYPHAVVVSGLPGLLWLVVPASLASVVVFNLSLERVMLRALRGWGVGLPRIRLVEGMLGSLSTALALAATARLLPAVELSLVAALTAGMIGAFVRYYFGVWMDDAVLGGVAGAEADYFDEETD